MGSQKRKSTWQFTLIPEFSWWRSADGRRLLCVIEKKGRAIDNVYRTTVLGLIECGIAEKKYVDYESFARQVADGKLEQVGFADIDVRNDLLVYPR
jgi:hypothetical protein